MTAGDSALEALTRVLDTIPGIAVAVSGGVDSLTLATVAHRHMAASVAMFHAVSPAVPGAATRRVRALAAREGWALEVVDADEFNDPNYRENPVDRCFYCKSHLYAAIAARTTAQMVSGTNIDDLGEYRPGLEAARSRGVRHPYVEARIGKRALRAIARDLGLADIADLPASPCLSSRIETAIVIEPDVLELVDLIETSVKRAIDAPTVRCRVRSGGMVIELDGDSLQRLGRDREAEIRDRALAHMNSVGRWYDLSFETYRNGSAFLHQPGSARATPA